jgi:hypothetical protein
MPWMRRVPDVPRVADVSGVRGVADVDSRVSNPASDEPEYDASHREQQANGKTGEKDGFHHAGPRWLVVYSSLAGIVVEGTVTPY